jgi:hypothetical protein
MDGMVESRSQECLLAFSSSQNRVKVRTRKETSSSSSLPLSFLLLTRVI